MTTALIDADGLVYRATVTAETAIDWGDGEEVTKEVDLEEAYKTASDMVEDWSAVVWADRTILCFSSYPCFRKVVLPTYKSKRPDEKPAAYWAVVKYLSEKFKTITIPTLEADDVMGILATNGRHDEPVIISPDKDMKTIPNSTIYDPLKKVTHEISDDDAAFFWAYQILMGDQVDGFAGCPGIGKVKARAILEPLDRSEYWPTIVATFESKNLTAEDALVQARVARILRASDYDHPKQEINLWTPASMIHAKLTLPISQGS